jgi:hypothetical protein
MRMPFAFLSIAFSALSAVMTPEQIAQGQGKASAWWAKHKG